jgi:hypothetical protein
MLLCRQNIRVCYSCRSGRCLLADGPQEGMEHRLDEIDRRIIHALMDDARNVSLP